MIPPKVSIIILNFNYPHNIKRLLPTLQKTSGVDYETVVVDNGSEADVVELLKDYKEQGLIDTLVLEPKNNYFSEGNNIGVRHSNPDSEFILLLNNDTEILDGSWLIRMLDWSVGKPEIFFPYAWSPHPTIPKEIQRGIVSIDYCYNRQVPGDITPDGWCCLFRREAWIDIDPDFPMAFGIMKMVASVLHNGYQCGVLSQYGPYIKHYGQGSTPPTLRVPSKSRQNMPEWWKGVSCESLDFTLGEHETESFMSWSPVTKIKEEYENAYKQPTDMNEHVPILYELAKECNSVVEAGVRYVVSSWAWILGCACRGGRVDSYCWTLIPEIQRALDICKEEGLPWHFHDGDWLQQEIPVTDLLFIDTNHFYSQLSEELQKHGNKARKYIVLHDTEHFKTVGADGKTPGLEQAIEEFIARGAWQIKKHYSNCNGLTILERSDG